MDATLRNLRNQTGIISLQSIHIRGQKLFFFSEKNFANCFVGVNRKRGRREKTPKPAIPFPESLVSPPGEGKDSDQKNPENKVEETVF